MKIKEALSDFGIQAVELDQHFSEIQKLSYQIEHLDINSDSDFRLAVKLLTKFSENALDLEKTVGQFSKFLEEAREKSDHAVKAVASKAAEIQQRKQDQDQIESRLSELGSKVRQVIPILANFKRDDEQKPEPTELLEVNSRIGEFIEEARTIKDWAQEHKFKDASRSAESLQATLESAKTKLGSAIATIH
jgi:hypothetical protein